MSKLNEKQQKKLLEAIEGDIIINKEINPIWQEYQKSKTVIHNMRAKYDKYRWKYSNPNTNRKRVLSKLIISQKDSGESIFEAYLFEASIRGKGVGWEVFDPDSKRIWMYSSFEEADKAIKFELKTEESNFGK